MLKLKVKCKNVTVKLIDLNWGWWLTNEGPGTAPVI